MYSQVQPPGKLVGMTALEIDAVKKFVETFTCDFYPLQVANVLRQSCIIDETVVGDIKYMQRRRVSHKIIVDTLITETTKSCSLEELIKTLYENNFKEIARKLFECYLYYQNQRYVLRVNRADTSNRQEIGKYFKHIKELVHAMAFKHAYTDVQKLGTNMESRIRVETDPMNKMRLCDKFVALKAAEMDALTNIAGKVSKNHQGYMDIQKYITSTSNPALSQVILLGRQSDVLSTIGEFEEAENLIKNALVNADTSGSCVEVTDMLYKNVVVKLSKFERFPNDEELRKSIIYEADRGMWTLQEVQEDLRLFWTKLFLLRITFLLILA